MANLGPEEFDLSEYACPICGSWPASVNQGLTLRKHGPPEARCPGSNTSALLLGHCVHPRVERKSPCVSCGEPEAAYEDLSGNRYCEPHWEERIPQMVAETRQLPAMLGCRFCGSKDTTVVEANNVAFVLCTSCAATGPHCKNRAEACEKWDKAFR